MLEYCYSVNQVKRKFSLLALILLSALLVRLWGFKAASYYIDEATLLDRARKIMTGEEIFNPRFPETMIAYGMIVSYIHAFFMKIVYSFGHLVYGWDSVGDVYPVLKLTARFISVLAGTGTVYFTYLTAKKLFNWQVGLFSALILAFSFNHVTLSQYAVVDIYISFFLSVALYFAALILAEKKKLLRAYILGGIFSSLAFAIKYNFPVFIPVLAAHTISVWQSISTKKNKFLIYLLKWWRPELLIFLIFALGVFLIVTPYLVINPTNYFWQLTTILRASWDFPMGSKDLDNIPNIIWYLHYMVKIGLYYPFFAFVVGGIVIALAKYKTQAIFLLSYPVTQLILLEIYSPRADRYPVWWLPMLAVFGGLFLWQSVNFISRIKLGQKLAMVILILLVALPVFRVLAFDFAITFQKDTRLEARKFFLRNSRPIYFIADIDGKFLDIVNSQLFDNHALRLLGLDPQSNSPYNIFRYPGEYLLITDFVFGEAFHYLRHNPGGKIFYPRPQLTEKFLLDYLQEGRLITDFMQQTSLVKAYSRLGFRNGLFDSVRLYGGDTEVGASYNPNIKIYKIPYLKETLPTLAVIYYPHSVAISGYETLRPVNSSSFIVDKMVQKGQVILMEKSERGFPIIQASKSPFPPGEYLVKIRLKIDPKFVSLKKVYGFITFGDQTILGNIGYQEIKGANLQVVREYQTISLPFRLSAISNTLVELTWIDLAPAMVEKIEIIQVK